MMISQKPCYSPKLADIYEDSDQSSCSDSCGEDALFSASDPMFDDEDERISWRQLAQQDNVGESIVFTKNCWEAY